MNELVKLSAAVIGGEEQQTVNARDLWTALESKQEFSRWIKNRLADFTEGQDYAIDKIVKRGVSGATGTSWSNEYTLTLDVAKHLAMLERNERGKAIRQYFIEVEKRSRQLDEIAAAVLDRMEGRIFAYVETIARQQSELKLLRAFAPKGEPGDISRKTGQPKYRFRRGYYTSSVNARPVKLLIQQPDLPGLTIEEAYLIETKQRCSIGVNMHQDIEDALD